MKKCLLSLMLSIALMLTSVPTIYASSDTYYIEETKVEILESNYNYSQLRFTEPNGDVSVAEQRFDNNGIAKEYVLVNEEGEKELEIYKQNDKIVTYKGGNFESQMVDSFKESDGITTRAWTTWSKPVRTTGHKALWYGITASALTGIVSMIFNLPGWSSIVAGVVTTVLTDKLKDLWYTRDRSYRFDMSIHKYQGRDVTKLYKYSNYTGLIKSYTSTWTGDATN